MNRHGRKSSTTNPNSVQFTVTCTPKPAAELLSARRCSTKAPPKRPGTGDWISIANALSLSRINSMPNLIPGPPTVGSLPLPQQGHNIPQPKFGMISLKTETNPSPFVTWWIEGEPAKPEEYSAGRNRTTGRSRGCSTGCWQESSRRPARCVVDESHIRGSGGVVWWHN